MDSMDLRGTLAAHIMRGRYGAKKNGKVLAFRCPRHDDGTASAWLGDYRWGCWACGFEESLTSLAGEFGIPVPEQPQRGLTLDEYADRKGLSRALLATAGVTERIGQYGDAMVAIPYRDAAGQTIRTKLRGRKGTWWDRDGEGVPLYGQDILAQRPNAPVLVVEGESDCHAGWQRGICVVGLPGANQWRSEYARLLAGREVWVWQEPDEGGATLTASVAKDLPKAKIIRDVSHQGDLVKDLCDLHQRVPDQVEFEVVFAALLANAIPVGAEPPVVAFDAIAGDTLRQLLDEKLAPIDAVPTPLASWNALCGGNGGAVGLARGWFITIGANTGTGKSLVACNLAAEAVRQGEVVCFISLEMGRSELATRYLAVLSGEAVGQLEQGSRFQTGAWMRAAAYADGLRAQTGGHMLVNRRPISSLKDVTHCIRYYAEHHNCRYFVVDYIQLAWTQSAHTINERMELVAHQLRDITHQHNCVMVGLSQFNRQTSAARKERPVAQGLMGGSSIENDSHQVLLFDHSRWTRNGDTADTWLIVDKNRHGPVEDIPVQWDFRNLRLSQRVPSIEEQISNNPGLLKIGRAT